jgi:hypothetical protein
MTELRRRVWTMRPARTVANVYMVVQAQYVTRTNPTMPAYVSR